jgi:hypothetical protein
MRCASHLGFAVLLLSCAAAYPQSTASQVPTDTPPPARNSKSTTAQPQNQTPPAAQTTQPAAKTSSQGTAAPATQSAPSQSTAAPTAPSAQSAPAQNPPQAQTAPANDVQQSSTAPADVPAEKPLPKVPTPTPEENKDAAKTAAKKSDSLPSPGEALDPHIKAGSENDVNAVGTRNIGGRGVGNWYSIDSEIRMGKQYSMEIEKSAHMITDPVVMEYVNRVGQNIVKNSDCKVPFTIKVIDSDEINAMALPGGFFYVNSGLILAADEEAELAGVMAHETAHVCAHHAARQMTKLNYVQIGSIPLIIMTSGTWTGYGIYEATQLAIPIAFLKFSRIDEAEADWLGMQYMYKAGYDPQAFVQFFEKIDALEKHKPGTLAKVFADHPQTPDRINRSEDEIATILPAKPDYIVSTSEFDDVKARLARIENKRKLNDKNGGNKPTLRRVGTGSGNNDPNNPNNPSSNTDDRPTLGRRD